MASGVNVETDGFTGFVQGKMLRETPKQRLINTIKQALRDYFRETTSAVPMDIAWQMSEHLANSFEIRIEPVVPGVMTNPAYLGNVSDGD